MSGQGEVMPAEWARRVQADLSASSPSPETGGELLGYTVVLRGVVAMLGSRESAEAEAAAWRSQQAVVAEVRAVTTGAEIRAARLAERLAADQASAARGAA